MHSGFQEFEKRFCDDSIAIVWGRGGGLNIFLKEFERTVFILLSFDHCFILKTYFLMKIISFI